MKAVFKNYRNSDLAGRVGFLKMIRYELLSLAIRVGRAIAKIFDICAFPELMDHLWQIVKINTRKLTAVEEKEAQSIFGNRINYQKVHIDEASFLAWLGAKLKRCSGMGVATFHTVNFNRKLNTTAGSSDMKWLIHELTHVAQMEHTGSQYLVEAFHAQASDGYAYRVGEKRHFREYNREQQACIVADYYISRFSGGSTAAYDPYIAELRAGDL
ncbi:hypothetical protein MSBRW_1601 [Methanosarcina barkeri str. Wiesmoor]|uniref:DUF4157 domain-containing protein n=2 Tax=Methanosarcina barkeri TaxID=2208 RepID=A0A0E3QMB7_METBA|nr:hypothetical protein MSBRW_1601 [Methanosarcina barkeri str. Wiesmoor]